MTEQVVRARAECEDCGKIYRVPDADRTYTCKACGGSVYVPDDDYDEEEAEERRHPAEPETAADRHEATVALQGVFSKLTGLTWFYILGAGASAVAAFFAMVELAQGNVSLNAGILVVGLVTVLGAVFLMAAIQLDFKPLVWAIVAAAAATVAAAGQLAAPEPFGVPFFVCAALAVLGWGAVLVVRALSEVIEQHEDLYILHHAGVHKRRSLKSRRSGDQHERLLDFMDEAAAKARTRSIVVAAVFVAVSAIGAYAVVTTVRAEDHSAAVARFESAWNGRDLDAIAEMFDERFKERESSRLAAVIAGHGWTGALPVLADGQTREEEDLTWVDYAKSDMTISASWVLDGQRWGLVKVDLPAPPIEAAFERFVESWKSSDAEGLVSFFAEQHREKMLDYVQKVAKRKDWESFPAIRGRDVGEYVDEEVIATLDIEDGTVTTKWHVQSDGTWGMHALVLPSQ